MVGGGIIGCACAYELSRRGASVVLFERAELAAGASGRNHGLLLSPLEADLVPMAQGSADLYRDIEPVAPMSFDLDPEPIGFVVVAADESEVAPARAEAEAAAAAGVRIREVGNHELAELEPDLAGGLAGGWLLEDGRRVDPASLTVALGLLAGEHMADLGRHTTVRAVVRSGDRVGGVVTDDGFTPADAVVVAAGPWSSPLLARLGHRLPVTGARGWLVHLAPERPVLRRIVNRAGWHILGEESGMAAIPAGSVAAAYPEPDVGSLLHHNRDGTMLVGGSRQAVVTAEPEDPDVPRRILERAIRLVPALSDARVLSAWWGLRPMTPDGRPIVGQLMDGLFVATGHGGQGVILGGGTAQLVASMVLAEDPPFDPAPYSPARFERRGP